MGTTKLLIICVRKKYMGDSPVMELLNLILTGEASSNLFDGTKLLRFQDNQSKLLKGINQKTSIGFISILEDISLIGNHLKYPDSNIFVVHELNHYSVTFSLDKESKRIKSMIYIDPFSNSGEIVLNLGEKNVLNGTDFVSCRGKLDTFKKIQVILKMIIAEKEAKSALKSQTHMSREKEEFEHQFRDCVSQLTTNASVAVDWAALAKQWIQMQKTQPQVTSSPPVLPPVPPPSVTAPPILHPPPPGHGPMRPDDFPPEVPVNAPLMKAPMGPAGMPEQFSNDRPFENEPAAFIQKPVSNAYWNKSHWEASTANEVDDRLWPAPPPPPPIEPTSSLISGKETYDYGHMHDNPPLAMQSIDYNHMSEYSYNQASALKLLCQLKSSKLRKVEYDIMAVLLYISFRKQKSARSLKDVADTVGLKFRSAQKCLRKLLDELKISLDFVDPFDFIVQFAKNLNFTEFEVSLAHYFACVAKEFKDGSTPVFYAAIGLVIASEFSHGSETRIRDICQVTKVSLQYLRSFRSQLPFFNFGTGNCKK